MDSSCIYICFCLLIISLIVVIFYDELYESVESVVYLFSAVIVTCVSAMILVTSKDKGGEERKDGGGVTGGFSETKELFKYSRLDIINEIKELTGDNKNIEKLLNANDVFDIENRPLNTLTFQELETEKMDMLLAARSLSPPEGIRTRYLSRINKMISESPTVKKKRDGKTWALNNTIVNAEFLIKGATGSLFVESTLLAPPDEKTIFSLARILHDFEVNQFIDNDADRRLMKLLFSMLHFRHLPATCPSDYLDTISLSPKDYSYYMATYSKLIELVEDIMKKDKDINLVDTTDSNTIKYYLNEFEIKNCSKEGAGVEEYTIDGGAGNRTTSNKRTTNSTLTPKTTSSAVVAREERLRAKLEEEIAILRQQKIADLDEEMEKQLKIKEDKLRVDIDDADEKLFDTRAGEIAEQMLEKRKEELRERLEAEMTEERELKEKEMSELLKEKEEKLSKELRDRLNEMAANISVSSEVMDEGSNVIISNHDGFRPSLNADDKAMDKSLDKTEETRMNYLFTILNKITQYEKLELSCLQRRSDGDLRHNRTRNIVLRRPKIALMPKDETGKSEYSANYGKLVSMGYIRFAFGPKPVIATGMLNVWRMINDLHLRLLMVYISNKKRIAQLNNISKGKCLESIYKVGEKIEQLEAEVKALKNASEDMAVFSKTREDLYNMTKEKEALERKYNYLMESGGTYSKIESLQSDLDTANKKLTDAQTETDSIIDARSGLLSKLSERQVAIQVTNKALKQILAKEVKHNKDMQDIIVKTEELKLFQKEVVKLKKKYEQGVKEAEHLAESRLSMIRQKEQLLNDMWKEKKAKDTEMIQIKDKIRDLDTQLRFAGTLAVNDKEKMEKVRVSLVNAGKNKFAIDEIGRYIDKAIVKYKEREVAVEKVSSRDKKLIFQSIDKVNSHIKDIDKQSAKLVSTVENLKRRIEKESTVSEKERRQLKVQINELDYNLKKVREQMEPFFITNGAGFHYMKEYIRDLLSQRNALLKKMNEVIVKDTVKYTKQGNIDFFEKKVNEDKFLDTYARERADQYRKLIFIDNKLAQQIDIVERYNNFVNVLFKDYKPVDINSFIPKEIAEDVKGPKKGLIAEYEFLLSNYSSYIHNYNDTVASNDTLKAKNQIMYDRMVDAEKEVESLRKATGSITDDVITELNTEMLRLTDKVKEFYTRNTTPLEELIKVKAEMTKLSRDNNSKLREITELKSQIDKLREDEIINAQKSIDNATQEFHKELDEIVELLSLADRMKIPVEYGNANIGHIKKKQLMIVDRIRELLISDDYVKKADDMVLSMKKENEKHLFAMNQKDKIIEQLKKALETGGTAIYNLAGENAPKDVISDHINSLKTNEQIVRESIDNLEDLRMKNVKRLKDIEDSIVNNKDIARIINGIQAASRYMKAPYGIQSEESLFALLRCISSKGFKRLFIHRFVNNFFTEKGRWELKSAIESQPNNIKKGFLNTDIMYSIPNMLTEEGVRLVTRVFDRMSYGSESYHLRKYLKQFKPKEDLSIFSFTPKEIEADTIKKESIEVNEEEIVFDDRAEGDAVAPLDADENDFAESDEEEYIKKTSKDTKNTFIDEDDNEMTTGLVYEDEYDIDGFGEVRYGGNEIDLQSIFFILFNKLGLVDLSKDKYADYKNTHIRLLDKSNFINDLEFVVECVLSSVDYDDKQSAYDSLKAKKMEGHGKMIKEIILSDSINQNIDESVEKKKNIDLLLSYANVFFENPVFTEKEVNELLFSRDAHTGEAMDITDTHILFTAKEVQNYILVLRDIETVKNRLINYSKSIKETENVVMSNIPIMIQNMQEALQESLNELKKIAFVKDIKAFNNLISRLEVETNISRKERTNTVIDNHLKDFNKAVSEFKQTKEYNRYVNSNNKEMPELEIVAAVSVKKVVEMIEDFRRQADKFANVEESEAIFSNFYKMVESVIARLGDYSTEVGKTVNTLEKILIVNKQRSDEVEILKARIKELESSQTGEEKGVLVVRKDILRAESVINAYKSNMDEITSEVDKVLAEVTKIASDSSRAKNKTDALNYSISKHNENIKKIEQNIAKLLSSTRTHTDDIHLLETNVSTVHSAVSAKSEREQKLEELLREKSEIESMKAEEVNIYNSYRAELSVNNKKMALTETSLVNLGEQIKYIENIVNRLRMKSATLKDREQKSLEELKRLTAVISSNKVLVNELNNKLNDGNANVLNLVSIIQKLQEKSINIISSKDLDRKVSDAINKAVSHFSSHDVGVNAISGMIDNINNRWRSGLSTLDEYIEKNKKLEDEVRRLSKELADASDTSTTQASKELEDNREQLTALKYIMNIFAENKDSGDINIIQQLKDKSSQNVDANGLVSYLEAKRSKSLEIIDSFNKVLEGWGNMSGILGNFNISDKISAIILLYEQYKDKVEYMMKQKVANDEEATKIVKELESSLLSKGELEIQITKLQGELSNISNIKIANDIEISNSIISKDKEILYLNNVLDVMNKAVRNAMGDTSKLKVDISDITDNSKTVRGLLNTSTADIEEIYSAIVRAVDMIKSNITEEVKRNYENNRIKYERAIHSKYKERIEIVKSKLNRYETQLATYEYINQGLDSVREYIKISLNDKKTELEKEILRLTMSLRDEIINKNKLIEKNRNLLSVNSLSVDIVGRLKYNIKSCVEDITNMVISLDEIVQYSAEVRRKYDQALLDLTKEKEANRATLGIYNESFRQLQDIKQALIDFKQKMTKESTASIRKEGMLTLSIQTLNTRLSDYKLLVDNSLENIHSLNRQATLSIENIYESINTVKHLSLLTDSSINKVIESAKKTLQKDIDTVSALSKRDKDNLIEFIDNNVISEIKKTTIKTKAMIIQITDIDSMVNKASSLFKNMNRISVIVEKKPEIEYITVYEPVYVHVNSEIIQKKNKKKVKTDEDIEYEKFVKSIKQS